MSRIDPRLRAALKSADALAGKPVVAGAPKPEPNPLTLDALAELPRWVAWQAEARGGAQAPTKVPYAPAGGRARADDPSTWGTRQQAEASARKLPRPFGIGGVGIELGDLGNGLSLGGIDLDSCRNAQTGTMEAWALGIVWHFDTYTEVSPSQTGAKAFFLFPTGALPALRAAMGTDHGKSFKRPGGDHPPAIELHLGNRYFTVTGEQIADAPSALREIDEATLLWLIREGGPAFSGAGTQARSGHNGSTGADGSRSARAFRVARELHQAGRSFDDMMAALRADAKLAGWLTEKGTDRELRRLWERSGDEGAKSDAWPVPDMGVARADTLPAPALPGNVLPDGWDRWASVTAEASGSPRDYVAGALLSVAGAVIGNARWPRAWAGWQEPPIVNAALIGLPSSGKSPAMDSLTAILGRIEAASNDDWRERKRTYETAKAEALERRAAWGKDVKRAVAGGDTTPAMPEGAQEPDAPQRRRIFSTDSTVEKAARMSAGNPRGMLLLRDELAGWIASMDRYSNGAGSDRAFWLQSFGGRTWTQDRIKDGDREVTVPHLTWGTLGGIQPDRLASLLMAGDDDGLASRFLYIYPAQCPPTRPTQAPDHAWAERALTRLRELPWQPPEPVLLPLSAEAADALQEWRLEVAKMERDAGGLFLSWLGKLPGTALRLSGILEHLAWCSEGRGDPPAGISTTSMLRALAFLEGYAVPMARRSFGMATLPQAERDARVLARWLVQRKPVPSVVNARALRLMGDGPGIGNAERMTAALLELAELGWVRPAPARLGGGAGRQRSDWTVNPAIEDASRGLG